MKRIVLYPGSFDPVTVGHLDLIERATGLFDEVIVAVQHNPAKKGYFSVEERIALLNRCCARWPKVRIVSSTGLTTALARELGACAMLRGLRSEKDFQAEQELAQINRQICPEVETVFMLSKPEHQFISSSCVRELASFHGDLQGFVPEEIMPEIKAHFQS